MKTISIIKFILLLLISSLFGEEMSLRTMPVLEVIGDLMPGWEKEVMELYQDEVGNPIPVVFKGAAKNWEAAEWTLEYFKENFGDEAIMALSQKLMEEGLGYDEKGKVITSNNIYTTMKDHIADICLNPENAGYLIAPLMYNTTQEEVDYIKEKGSQFSDNIFFMYNYLNLESQTQFPQANPNELRTYSLLMGSKNSILSLHSHGSTFFSQMDGKQIIRLIDPKYIEKCSCKYENGFVSRCAIDIENPDFEQYPDLKEIVVQEVILEAGDVLYIPSTWLIDIRGLDSASISIANFGINKNTVFSLSKIPVLEIEGEQMPKSEKQIMEGFSYENGQPAEPSPVVFRGAAKNWEVAQWTPKYLAENFGDEPIMVLSQKLLEESIDYDGSSEIVTRNNIQTTVKDHMNDICLNAEYSGYFFAPLRHDVIQEDIDYFKEMGKEFSDNMQFVYNLNLQTQTHFPEMAIKENSDAPRSYIVFIGSQKTVSSLHSHGSTFLAQVYGEKIVRLIDPKYIKQCACKQEKSFVSRCAVDIEKPDFEKYLGLSEIIVLETILKAGDVLYIPDGWLHDVRGRGESPSISISNGF